MTKRSHSIGACFLLGSLLILWSHAQRPALDDQDPQVPKLGAWPGERTSQLVFFAVLEGLYQDGFPNDLVDRVLDRRDGAEFHYETNFVVTCKLCGPVFEAFRLYRERPNFVGVKGEANTFGTGPAAEVIAALRSEDAKTRRGAVQQLVTTWIERRLAAMKLTDEERMKIDWDFQVFRKEGMSALQSNQANGHYEGWTTCPSCEGGVEACQRR